MATRRPRRRNPAYPLCLLPARGGSKRFLRKNIAPLDGRPIISYPISAARQSGIFDEVYVSTEDAEIADIARKEGAAIIDRPAELATDEASVPSVVLHALDVLASAGKHYDVACIIYPTAALMLPEDLRGGWNLLLEKHANVSTAVTRYFEHPLHAYRQTGQFIRRASPSAPSSLLELPQFLAPGGSFTFVRADILRERGTTMVPRVVGYPIPRDRSIDIDEPEHLRVVEALLKASGRSR